MDSKYNNFDVAGFEKAVTGKVKEDRTYVNIIRTLRRYVMIKHNGRFPRDTTGMLYNYIKAHVKKSEWATYCKAIGKYEALMLGGRGMLFSGPKQKEIRMEYDSSEIQEPKYTRQENVRRINKLKDPKARTQALLQLYSGARIAEISALEPEDIKIIDSERLQLHIKHAKGDVELYITTLPNEELVEAARNGIEVYPKDAYDRRLTEVGIVSHDLRKHNLRDRYKRYRAEGFRKNPAAR